jgi:DNA-binding MarR family transcriptional regulator
MGNARTSAQKGSAAREKPRFTLPLPRFLPYRISILSALIGRAVGESYRTKPGLSAPEWKVMSVLAYYGATPSGDIGRYVTLDRTAISRALARLAELGFVNRMPNRRDQRMFLVDLTAAGQKAYDRIARDASKIEAAILENLTADEITELYRLFDKLEGYFRCQLDPRRPALVNTVEAARESKSSIAGT